MKKRILNYGLPATHDSIVTLAGFFDSVAISDFDAFLMDPQHFAGQITPGQGQMELINRRRREARELVERKGGIIICLLRPNSTFGPFGGFSFDRYAFFTSFSLPIVNIGAGEGDTIIVAGDPPSHPVHRYLRVLKGNLRFEAYIDNSPGFPPMTTLAVNSVGHPVAATWQFGEGLVCFVPVPHGVAGDRIGAALVQTVAAHYVRDVEVDAPSWAADINVPGTQSYDEQLTQLKTERERILEHIASLELERSHLLGYKRLLFGTGKAVLEPAVRSSFRLLGFQVPEPEEYSADWDVYLTAPDGTTAIGEVEGAEGAIDVDKYRQLLDYIDAEVRGGKNHKGILVGNGFRSQPLDAPERQRQFSEHVQRGATRQQFCLVPTTQLFNAVCAVLESPSEELKRKIRSSILSAVGEWRFAK